MPVHGHTVAFRLSLKQSMSLTKAHREHLVLVFSLNAAPFAASVGRAGCLQAVGKYSGLMRS